MGDEFICTHVDISLTGPRRTARNEQFIFLLPFDALLGKHFDRIIRVVGAKGQRLRLNTARPNYRAYGQRYS